MKTTAMRIMRLLFLRSRLTDDTLMDAHTTLFQVNVDDTQSRKETHYAGHSNSLFFIGTHSTP